MLYGLSLIGGNWRALFHLHPQQPYGEAREYFFSRSSHEISPRMELRLNVLARRGFSFSRSSPVVTAWLNALGPP
jgi:hypothetical protein